LYWEKEGAVEFANESQPFDFQRSNLTFDNDHLVVGAIVDDQKISATVDTGALNTDLYKPFADKFENLLKQFGKKGSKEVRGVGHAEVFDAVTLPELRIRIADFNTVLSPAHAILKSIWSPCCVGNFGMDLFKQASVMRIDFGAMAMQLTSTANGRAPAQSVSSR
jgi:hypothetical protein